MPSTHAILAPSGSSRWIRCTPSARLEALEPEKETAYTREGTIAHAMAEILLRQALELGWDEWREDYPDKFRTAYEAVTSGKGGTVAGLGNELRAQVDAAVMEGLDPWEMLQTVSDYYCRFVWEDYLDAKYRDPDAVLLVEARLKLDEFIPEGFGSSDAVIIQGHEIAVYDLKYGKGVKVSAVGNTQMRCYALGALLGPGELYDIDDVAMVILQPRLQWTSTDNIKAAALMDWAENELKPAAIMAWMGKGNFCVGDHCRFCKVAPRCKTLLKWSAALPAQKDGLMNDEELAETLKKAGTIKSWIASLEAYALDRAMNGNPVPGFKVVEGKSNRTIPDQKAAISALAKAGLSEDSYLRPRELKTISDLEKLLTKKGFNTILGQYVVKPQGKPTLVEDSDPRPAMNSATEDFKEYEQ